MPTSDSPGPALEQAIELDRLCIGPSTAALCPHIQPGNMLSSASACWLHCNTCRKNCAYLGLGYLPIPYRKNAFSYVHRISLSVSSL